MLAPIVAHVTANPNALFATKYQVFDRMMADIRVIGMVTVGAATIAAIIYLQIKQIDEKPTGYSGEKENILIKCYKSITKHEIYIEMTCKM